MGIYSLDEDHEDVLPFAAGACAEASNVAAPDDVADEHSDGIAASAFRRRECDNFSCFALGMKCQ